MADVTEVVRQGIAPAEQSGGIHQPAGAFAHVNRHRDRQLFDQAVVVLVGVADDDGSGVDAGQVRRLRALLERLADVEEDACAVLLKLDAGAADLAGTFVDGQIQVLFSRTLSTTPSISREVISRIIR